MMHSVELKLQSGSEVTLFFSGNLAISRNCENGKVTVADGVHNNGGWPVAESYDVVVNKIKEALGK